MKPDERIRPGTRDLQLDPNPELQVGRPDSVQTGGLLLYAEGDGDEGFTNGDTLGDTGSPSQCVPRGKLSFAVVKALWALTPDRSTYKDLIHSASVLLISEWPRLRLEAEGHSAAFNTPLFRLPDPGVIHSWTRTEHRAFDRLIGLLQRVIERQNGVYPECYVDLGIAYSLTEQYEKSVAALEMALRQRADVPDASYWLGRTLYESRDDLVAAVSRLQEANESDPHNPRVKYYLGQAIRLLVEQEMLSKAAEVLGGYLDAGAPLGDHDAVQEFVLEHTTTSTR